MDPLDPRLRGLLSGYRDHERMTPAARASAWLRLQSDLRAPAASPPPPRTSIVRPLAWGALLLAAAAAVLLLRRPAELVAAAPPEHQAVHDIADAATTELAHTRPSPAQTPSSPPPAPAQTASIPPATGNLPQTASIPPATGNLPQTASIPPSTSTADTPPPAPSAPAPTLPPRAGPPSDPRPATRTAPRPAPRTAPSADDPAREPSDLERELAHLRAARDALARGDATAAGRALDEHAHEFPAGLLREERQLLRVEALCAAGARDDARREATAFAQAHPNSPHAKAILRVCD